MATLNTNTAAHGNMISAALHRIAGLFTWIFDGLVRLAEASSRMHEVERLNAMTDKDLAKMGLQRTDIVRYVFRDML